jgi:predicted restriction endonuclease
VLYALGRLKHAGDERISFEASEEPIRDLIRAYTPPRSNARPNDPFRFLESDGCWRLDAQDRARLIDASGNARIGELRRQHATGGFTAEWLARFRAEPALIDEVADSDASRPGVPRRSRPGLRDEAGHGSDLKGKRWRRSMSLCA